MTTRKLLIATLGAAALFSGLSTAYADTPDAAAAPAVSTAAAPAAATAMPPVETKATPVKAVEGKVVKAKARHVSFAERRHARHERTLAMKRAAHGHKLAAKTGTTAVKAG